MGHFKQLCRQCGTLMAQCRCPAPEKTITYGVCETCKGKPWGPMDPNSQHQLWSSWTFIIHEPYGKHVPFNLVELNAANWLRKGFGSVGRARVTERVTHYVIEAQIEGVPAHDPDYVKSVERGFTKFIEQGWGPLAVGSVNVQILAGDQQDGKPRSQLVVMPHVRLQ